MLSNELLKHVWTLFQEYYFKMFSKYYFQNSFQSVQIFSVLLHSRTWYSHYAFNHGTRFFIIALYYKSWYYFITGYNVEVGIHTGLLYGFSINSSILIIFRTLWALSKEELYINLLLRFCLFILVIGLLALQLITCFQYWWKASFRFSHMVWVHFALDLRHHSYLQFDAIDDLTYCWLTHAFECSSNRTSLYMQ